MPSSGSEGWKMVIRRNYILAQVILLPLVPVLHCLQLANMEGEGLGEPVTCDYVR